MKALGKASMAAGGLGLLTTAYLVATGGMGAAAAVGFTILDTGLLYTGRNLNENRGYLSGKPGAHL